MRKMDAVKNMKTKLLDYAGNEIVLDDCPGCAFARREFSLPCGMVFEDDCLTIAQDWELPIDGMLIIAPKRHVLTFAELTQQERAEIFELANKTIVLLKTHLPNVTYKLFFEENGRHFHVWLLPCHEWMQAAAAGNPTNNLGAVFAYAKANLRTKQNIENIAKTCAYVREALKQESL